MAIFGVCKFSKKKSRFMGDALQGKMVKLHSWPGDIGQPEAQYKTGVRQILSHTRHLSGFSGFIAATA
jgi:hypothetical protein